MIVDSSAVVAVLLNEPDAAELSRAMAAANRCRISAVNFVEAAIVIDRSRDPIASRRFDEFLYTAGIVVEPVTAEQARIAREAYRDFGKTSGHPAKLNLGDCFAYALAKVQAEPLLFKGGNLIHTDIVPASSAR